MSEADFFSNSPFHIRLEELSRRILTPPRPGVAFQTKWFYERTRGQYLNEKGKLSTADEKKFVATYPRNQVITKTDAAKYAVSWARKPHLVSAGAQKNFVAFANEVAVKWETSDSEFNETYFKHLVAKGILFNSIRAEVAQQDWYASGYLANVVTYTIAKMADAINDLGATVGFDFEAIWAAQRVSDATMKYALSIAERVMAVLTSDARPVTNVTEWAKRAECWAAVQAMHMSVPTDFRAELVDGAAVRTARRAARVLQRVDDGIQGQTAVLAIPAVEWAAIQEFAVDHRLLTPTDAGILALVTGARPGVPSERQAARLLEIQRRVIDNGYHYTG